MGKSKNTRAGSNSRSDWTWFTIGMISSFLPLMVYAVIKLETCPACSGYTDFIRLNDVVYVGLTLNISNLHVVKLKMNENRKIIIMFFSLIGVVGLTLFLKDSYFREDFTFSTWIVAIACLFASIVLARMTIIVRN